MATTYDLTTEADCIAFLVDRRFTCRRFTQFVDEIHDENSADRHLAAKYRAKKNPMLDRSASVIDARIKHRCDSIKPINDEMVKIGRELMSVSHQIDAMVPRSRLLDVLNVNPADRAQIQPEWGFIDIVHIHNFEDSAMYRGSDTVKEPLSNAIAAFFRHEFITNKAFAQSAEEHLFGKGGMFEFLPRYQHDNAGNFVRMPPKLRIAEGCDLKEAS